MIVNTTKRKREERGKGGDERRGTEHLHKRHQYPIISRAGVSEGREVEGRDMLGRAGMDTGSFVITLEGGRRSLLYTPTYPLLSGLVAGRAGQGRQADMGGRSVGRRGKGMTGGQCMVREEAVIRVMAKLWSNEGTEHNEKTRIY